MKLTAKEKAWVKKVQRVLNECPSRRLGFYTIGDPDVVIYDRAKNDEIDERMDRGLSSDFCIAVQDTGAETNESLTFPAPVHSTAG